MSTLAVDNLKPSAGGTEFGIGGVAKAYAANTSDAGATAATLNHASITDTSVGTNTHTFTNAYINTAYCHSGALRQAANSSRGVQQLTGSDATASCSIGVATEVGGASGASYDVMWIGDLA